MLHAQERWCAQVPLASQQPPISPLPCCILLLQVRERRLTRLPEAHMYVGRTPLSLEDIRAWNALQEQGSMVSRCPGLCSSRLGCCLLVCREPMAC